MMTCCAAAGFFCLTGTIGFFATLLFIRTIYAAGVTFLTLCALSPASRCRA